VRVGGSWRFVHKEADGSENGFRGEFREIVPPERIVQTFEWEGMPGHIMTDHITFEDLGEAARGSSAAASPATRRISRA